MGKAYRLYVPRLTLEDIMYIKYENPKYRLTTSPFGLTPREYAENPPRYLSRAVSWKGLKGKDFEEAAPAEVVAGLKRAIAISKACAGIKGTTIYNGRVYPRKCIEQKKKAGKLAE